MQYGSQSSRHLHDFVEPERTDSEMATARLLGHETRTPLSSKGLDPVDARMTPQIVGQ